MSAGSARGDESPPRPPLRDAAVLVPVYRDATRRLRIVLLRRAAGGLHGGQIALPGGKRDSGDASLAETAIREAEEEIGLPRAAVDLLAELPVIETRSTGFRIAPFLARIRPPAGWILAEEEVAEVMAIAVEDLLLPGIHDSSLETLPGWSEPRRIPFYRMGPDRLWGATYRILHPLLPRLLAGEWKI